MSLPPLARPPLTTRTTMTVAMLEDASYYVVVTARTEQDQIQAFTHSREVVFVCHPDKTPRIGSTVTVAIDWETP
jgi:GMP synthase-like glutamine amidotransferase